MSVFALIFAITLLLEARRPLRRVTQPKGRRVLTNLVIAATAALFLRLSFYPMVMALAFWANDEQLGLLHWIKTPTLVTMALSVVLLDWTFYYWHWLLHKIPFLWRFHNAHHVDLDLDSSTALRFHFGELAISTAYRSAQILIFGISPLNLALFEFLITTFAQFHHSNVRLPLGFEQALGKITITPRLHGIHHSTVRSERDSNFGTIFSWWDLLHRSLVSDIPQDRITIGVASYQNPTELGILGTLSLPFRRQRP